MALQTVRVTVNGLKAKALVDSGCTQSIILSSLSGPVTDVGRKVTIANGSEVCCLGVNEANMQVNGVNLKLACLVMEHLPRDFEVILGMDAIGMLGGMTITSKGVFFPLAQISTVSLIMSPTVAPTEKLRIVDDDFEAEFVDGHWEVGWKWNNEPPILLNSIGNYGISSNLRDGFDSEINSWIKEGWLQQIDGPHKGIIPLMAVDQTNKGKIIRLS